MAKTCIITGGTSGIGAATAAILRTEGWEVIPTGFTDQELAAAGPGARRLDVRDNAAIEALFAEFDELHGLVNAAGARGAGREANGIEIQRVSRNGWSPEQGQRVTGIGVLGHVEVVDRRAGKIAVHQRRKSGRRGGEESKREKRSTAQNRIANANH